MFVESSRYYVAPQCMLHCRLSVCLSVCLSVSAMTNYHGHVHSLELYDRGLVVVTVVSKMRGNKSRRGDDEFRQTSL